MSKKLIVAGGGAAGFFCAVNAARMNPGLKVILVEKSNKLLSKVKVSGGGRCNVTHHCFDITEMSRKYPRGQHFVKKTFHEFFTTDTVQWFEERGVKLKAEEDGRLFPVTDSSQTIIDCLLREVNKYGVDVRLNKEVKKINVKSDSIKNENSFVIEFANGENIDANFICIASGGYPKSSMFDWLKELGHSIEEPVPSLFTFNMPGHPITKLMGVSVENARVKIMGTKLEQEGPVLITHWGLSGPAVLRSSAWGARELAVKNYEFQVLINWLPQFTEQEFANELQRIRFDMATQKISNKNPFGLPNRLWEFLLDHSGINKELRWADLPARDQNRLVKNICACEFAIKGKTTFKEEFVTAGGIRLSEINPATMESKKLPGLFFAGEVVDVDGITGGFNFQHAWTSGWVAAKGVGAYLSS
jgi:predicted Rossmann fold flavoprotein